MYINFETYVYTIFSHVGKINYACASRYKKYPLIFLSVSQC